MTQYNTFKCFEQLTIHAYHRPCSIVKVFIICDLVYFYTPLSSNSSLLNRKPTTLGSSSFTAPLPFL